MIRKYSLSIYKVMTEYSYKSCELYSSGVSVPYEKTYSKEEARRLIKETMKEKDNKKCSILTDEFICRQE